MTSLPTSDHASLTAWMRSHDLGHGACVGAVLSAYRHDLTTLLDQAAAGRREDGARAPESIGGVLDFDDEAILLESVARLVAGDMGAMTAWLPSWRWTDEMTEGIR
jgi:hypothetical protein